MPVAIILRSVKGSNLTPTEVDTNFTNLKDAVEDLQDNPTPPNGIASIVQEGTQLTIYLDDSTTLGPFTLPSATAITPFAEKAGTTLTLASADRSTYMRFTHQDGCFVSWDDDDLPLHSELHFFQAGGPVILEETTDRTINRRVGFDVITGGFGCVMTLKKVGDTEYDLFGALAEIGSTAT